MKMKLLVVAVASAIAAPAMAQNVTVYGILDYSLVSKSNQGGSATVSTTTQRFVASNLLSSSRLGVKGTEDLGGGLKANFVIEGSANTLDTGSLANLADRQGTIGLTGAFGGVDLGTKGSILDTISNFQTPNVMAAGLTTGGMFGLGTTGKVQNAISYETPSFNGVTARVTYSPNAAATEGTTGATKKNGEHTSFGLTGTMGGLSFAVGQAKQKTSTAAVAAASCRALIANATNSVVAVSTAAAGGACSSSVTADWSATGGSNLGANGDMSAATVLEGVFGGTGTTVSTLSAGTTAVAAQDGETKDTGLAVGYNFGPAVLNYIYVKTETSGTMTTRVDRTANGLVLKAPMGQLTPYLGYMRGENDATASADVRSISAGVTYDLSKRTTGYAVYQKITNQAAATQGGTTQAGADPTVLGIGVRHTF